MVGTRVADADTRWPREVRWRTEVVPVWGSLFSSIGHVRPDGGRRTARTGKGRRSEQQARNSEGAITVPPRWLPASGQSRYLFLLHPLALGDASVVQSLSYF